MKTLAKVIGVASLMLFAMQSACWRTVIVSESPDRQYKARVKEWCIAPDCAIKAEVTSIVFPSTIGAVEDGDISFAHVTWSPDSSRVGVLVVNAYGADIKAAYDTRNKKQIPFNTVEDLVRDSIRSNYKLTPSDLNRYANDPLQWAVEDDQAHRRFRKLIGR